MKWDKPMRWTKLLLAAEVLGYSKSQVRTMLNNQLKKGKIRKVKRGKYQAKI